MYVLWKFKLNLKGQKKTGFVIPILPCNRGRERELSNDTDLRNDGSLFSSHDVV